MNDKQTSPASRLVRHIDDAGLEYLVSAKGAKVFRAIQRTDRSVDYWDAEP